MNTETKEKKKYAPRKYDALRSVDGPKVERRCHACDCKFFSESKYNILCSECKQNNDWESYEVAL
jgi:hypothetical protein